MLEDKPVFNRTAHKALWLWRAQHTSCYSADWPGWKSNGGPYEDVKVRCFACKYVDERESIGCGECPLIWPGGKHATCMFTDRRSSGISARFSEAVDSGQKHKASRYAHIIANLPVKEGVKTC